MMYVVHANQMQLVSFDGFLSRTQPWMQVYPRGTFFMGTEHRSVFLLSCFVLYASEGGVRVPVSACPVRVCRAPPAASRRRARQTSRVRVRPVLRSARAARAACVRCVSDEARARGAAAQAARGAQPNRTSRANNEQVNRI